MWGDEGTGGGCGAVARPVSVPEAAELRRRRGRVVAAVWRLLSVRLGGRTHGRREGPRCAGPTVRSSTGRVPGARRPAVAGVGAAANPVPSRQQHLVPLFPGGRIQPIHRAWPVPKSPRWASGGPLA